MLFINDSLPVMRLIADTYEVKSFPAIRFPTRAIMAGSNERDAAELVGASLPAMRLGSDHTGPKCAIRVSPSQSLRKDYEGVSGEVWLFCLP